MVGTFQRLESSRHWKVPMAGKRRGFTLLELLAVLLILSVLTGLGVKGYRLARRTALESRAAADLERLRTALNEYRVEYGRFPSQAVPAPFAGLPEINELTERTEGVELTDPWGHPYLYLCTNRFRYALWSAGQDAASASDDINPAESGY